MKKTSSLLVAAAAALLCSCGEEAREIRPVQDPIAIEFVHTIAPASRLIDDIYTTSMPGALYVGIYITDAAGNPITENAKYKTPLSGSTLVAQGTTLYWPYEGDIRTYSYAPYSEDATFESITHVVQENQDNYYYDSDLVVAECKAVQNKVYLDPEADRSISLEYKHMLSQINVSIELLGPWIKYYKVEISDLYSTCELNLKTATISALTNEGALKVSAFDNYAHDAQGNHHTSHFIAVPQTVPANQDFIVVTASDKIPGDATGQIKTYKFRLSEPLELKSGKSYGFTLKLVPEQEAMGATCSLAEWSEDDAWTPASATLTPQP